MTVLITLTLAGADTGPFSLYSDADGFLAPFETSVLKSALVSGYTSVLVPNGATVIRVQSTSVCTNYVDFPISGITTTTTSSSTSTTTSTSSSTTTTTTTPSPYAIQVQLSNDGDNICTSDLVTLYCVDNPLIVGSIIYNDPGLSDGLAGWLYVCDTFNGGNIWFIDNGNSPISLYSNC